jgi:hypothetical protein
VSDLSLSGRRAVIDFPVLDQAAAHTAPQGHIENRVETASRAAKRFAKSAQVRIVVNVNRRSR